MFFYIHVDSLRYRDGVLLALFCIYNLCSNHTDVRHHARGSKRTVKTVMNDNTLKYYSKCANRDKLRHGNSR